MTWDEESVLEAADTVGFGGTLWMLYLAKESHVGSGPTSDFYTEASSVKAYAKRIGLDEPTDPQIKTGYTNISRKIVEDADANRNSINNEKKPDLVCLSSLGVELSKTIDNNKEIENSLKRRLGVEFEEPQDPWWPDGSPDESNAVYLRTYADRSVRNEDEAEIEVIASFDCPRCQEVVKHDYDLKLNDGYIVDGWSRYVEVECENCELCLEHRAGDPYQKPRPI